MARREAVCSTEIRTSVSVEVDVPGQDTCSSYTAVALPWRCNAPVKTEASQANGDGTTKQEQRKTSNKSDLFSLFWCAPRSVCYCVSLLFPVSQHFAESRAHPFHQRRFHLQISSAVASLSLCILSLMNVISTLYQRGK